MQWVWVQKRVNKRDCSTPVFLLILRFPGDAELDKTGHLLRANVADVNELVG